MLKLNGKIVETRGRAGAPSLILSVSTNAALPAVLRNSRAYLADTLCIPKGFAHYLVLESQRAFLAELPEGASCTVLPDDFSYLGNDDVIRLSPDRGAARVLFRASSLHNSILVTERCNNYCLMCSQPPKDIDDSWILEEIEQLIPLIPKSTSELGLTGGEPALCGEQFLHILWLAKSYLPKTAIHLLSNGRSFSNPVFAKKYADIGHHDVVVGIPIYSDDPALHDYIVQARGAFDETIRGVLNLKKLNQKVEIRVVLHKQSVKRLKQLCEFLTRNLLFVDHVALMGLEMTGFTRANMDQLWVDPNDYKDVLSEAVSVLAKARMPVSVYNHQLCLVNQDVLPYYRKSISDWKNEYAPECQGCGKMRDCGGFFSSSIQNRSYRTRLKPFC